MTDHPTNQISPKSVWRLQVQGYADCSKEELTQYRPGIRFAYIFCMTIALFGILLTHIPTLIFLTIIAFMGIILPYHPFDYIYNYVIRRIIKKSAIPRRAIQLKFSCAVATAWLIGTIALIAQNHILAGQILGGSLVATAALVGFTDICIPSMLYNFITKKKINPYA